MQTYDLMIPGPVQLAPEVLDALGSQVIAHYGPEFTRFYHDTIELLKCVFQTSGDLFPLVGSGTAGLEAAISSVIGKNDEFLVLSNGYFGERIAEIGQNYTSKVNKLEFPLTEQIRPKVLRGVLEKDRNVKAVGVVHCETSTGLLNPVAQLAKVCKEKGVLIMVDAIASLGGVELPVDEWGIDICVSASQKCLESPPGLAFVTVAEDAWSALEATASSGWYLNLKKAKEYATSEAAVRHPTRNTFATPLLRALRKAVEGILAEGLDARFARHRHTAELLREGLSELGFELLILPAIASPTVVAAKGRKDLGADLLVKLLREDYQIQIGGGIGELEGKIFRIGNMGLNAQQERIVHLLEALRRLVREHAVSR